MIALEHYRKWQQKPCRRHRDGAIQYSSEFLRSSEEPPNPGGLQWKRSARNSEQAKPAKAGDAKPRIYVPTDMTAGLPKGKLAVEVSVVTVADPLPNSTIPHTTAVSAVAVFHGQAADAMFPVKVVVPWEHHSHISHVSLTFRVAPGFDAEVVLVDPAYVLCESRVVEDPAIESSAAPLAAGVEVVVTADGAPFTCGVKFTNHRGTLSAVLGETGETLAFEAYSRLYGR